MKGHKNCPICDKEVISDASKLQSCSLCGMVIDLDNMILVTKDGDEDYFCLHGCYEKYKEVENEEN